MHHLPFVSDGMESASSRITSGSAHRLPRSPEMVYSTVQLKISRSSLKSKSSIVTTVSLS